MEGENTHKAEELGQGGLLVEKHTHPGLEDFGVDGRGGLLVEKRTHPRIALAEAGSSWRSTRTSGLMLAGAGFSWRSARTPGLRIQGRLDCLTPRLPVRQGFKNLKFKVVLCVSPRGSMVGHKSGSSGAIGSREGRLEGSCQKH